MARSPQGIAGARAKPGANRRRPGAPGAGLSSARLGRPAERDEIRRFQGAHRARNETEEDRGARWDLSGAVADRDGGERESPPVLFHELAEAAVGIEDDDAAAPGGGQGAEAGRIEPHGMILDSRSSNTSLAPRSISSGIKTLMVALGTTVSIA